MGTDIVVKVKWNFELLNFLLFYTFVRKKKFAYATGHPDYFFFEMTDPAIEFPVNLFYLFR